MFKDSANGWRKKVFEGHMMQLEESLGFRPDLAHYEKLYAPPVPREKSRTKRANFDAQDKR
jgi:hypothetical protein